MNAELFNLGPGGRIYASRTLFSGTACPRVQYNIVVLLCGVCVNRDGELRNSAEG